MVEIKRSHDFNHSTWIIVEEARNNIVSICELVAGNEIHHPRGLIGDRITGKLKVGSYLTDDEIKSLNEDIKNPNRFRIESKGLRRIQAAKRKACSVGISLNFLEIVRIFVLMMVPRNPPWMYSDADLVVPISLFIRMRGK